MDTVYSIGVVDGDSSATLKIFFDDAQSKDFAIHTERGEAVEARCGAFVVLRGGCGVCTWPASSCATDGPSTLAQW